MQIFQKYTGSKRLRLNHWADDKKKYSWSPWNLGSITSNLNEIQNLVKIENFPELLDDFGVNRKFEKMKNKTWTLPQIWRGSRIYGSFVRQMNIYSTTDSFRKRK
jgi:hypothetical protein